MTLDPRTARFEQIRTRCNQLTDKYPGLEPAARDLNDAAPNFTAAVDRITLAINDGLGAADYSGSRGGSDGTSFAERQAITGRRDPAADTLAELDKAMARLADNLRSPHKRGSWACDNARTIWRTVQAWTPKAPTDKQRAAVEEANAGPEPLCQHCTPHRAKGHAERILYTGTVSGNLKDPIGLCRWCYDLVGRAGRLPLKSEIQRKDNGERVMVKVQTKC